MALVDPVAAHLAARCGRGVSRKSFEGGSYVAAQVGFRFRLRGRSRRREPVHLLPIARVTVEAAISSGTLVQSFCDQMRVVAR
jgi:hypothetical protein